MGGKRVAEGHERGWGNFWNFYFCFEMVHFSAEVTDAVGLHHHWFFEGGGITVKRLT